MNVDDLKVGNCASMEKEADGYEERGYCVGEEGGTGEAYTCPIPCMCACVCTITVLSH